MKQKLKTAGLFLFKYVVTPIAVTFGIPPLLVGWVTGLIVIAFKAGYNVAGGLPKQP